MMFAGPIMQEMISTHSIDSNHYGLCQILLKEVVPCFRTLLKKIDRVAKTRTSEEHVQCPEELDNARVALVKYDELVASNNDSEHKLWRQLQSSVNNGMVGKASQDLDHAIRMHSEGTRTHPLTPYLTPRRQSHLILIQPLIWTLLTYKLISISNLF